MQDIAGRIVVDDVYAVAPRAFIKGFVRYLNLRSENFTAIFDAGIQCQDGESSGRIVWHGCPAYSSPFWIVKELSARILVSLLDVNDYRYDVGKIAVVPCGGMPPHPPDRSHGMQNPARVAFPGGK